MASPLTRIINKFKYGLVVQSIRNLLTRAGIVITPYYWVQEGLIDTNVPEIDGQISDYKVEFLEAEDLQRFVNNEPPHSLDGLLADFKAGKKCLGLKYHDEFVSVLFINLNKCCFAPINLPLQDDEAYLTNMYTLQSFRGKNLAPYLRYKCYEILKSMGRNKIYSVSVYFNTSALKYKQKLNARNLKLVLYIELFKKIKWAMTLKTYH